MAQLPSTSLPIMAALDAGRNRAFVSLFGGTDASGRIAVYDLDTLQLIEEVEVRS